jgi:multidrug resistance efflux pump
MAVVEPVRAQLLVFDPSNYSQNLLTAARSLQQIQNQITSRQNQAQMLINQAKQLEQLPTTVLNDVERDYAAPAFAPCRGSSNESVSSVPEIGNAAAITVRSLVALVMSRQPMIQL